MRKTLSLAALSALAATLLWSGTADAAYGQRNYNAHFYPKTSEGYNAVKAYIYPSKHCDNAPYAGEVDLTFEGHWVAGGSYLRRITIANKTNQPFSVQWMREIDSGGWFDLPRVSLAGGQSWSHLINRSIKGDWSEFAFGSVIAVVPCGDNGLNEWVIRP
ncbi:hypothetical protein [Amycolatopsis sp. SID8362]|uniref:hypothetical protein n=1 Tax=Amycolatopsis sp. SID8362 TaxID=2690346 RepID=UPI001369DF4D|nr:hypothetical protein [Amycolatopsis sp. SID8362]NBH05119.1 hypothetical protein [Amycolatopsis sp. SID8362]NED41819.1 hypothetical protein [Amycolatopsis sp. SID8362]